MKRWAILTAAVTLGVAMGVILTYIVVTQEDSPYLKHPQHPGDVVAAIQVLGTYEFDGRLPDKWGELIGSNPASAVGGWSEVFREHPELFRTGEDNKVSIVWRRSRDRVWDTKTRKDVDHEQLAGWSVEDKETRLSREPLKPEEMTKLIELTYSMGAQAIARRQELRWWVPVVAGLIGVLIGALFKSETSETTNMTGA